MEKEVNEEITTWEEVEERAKLAAEADELASGSREEPEDETVEEENMYEVVFDKEYEFDNGAGKKLYKSIDMSGLYELTTVDGEIFDRVLAKAGHRPGNKYTDTTYTKHVAMRVTGLPVEFFNMLNIRDMQKVTAVVYLYFLRG